MWQGGPEPELRPLRPTGSIEPSIVRLVSTARGENTGGRGGMGIARMSRAWRLGLTGRFPLQGRLLMIGFYAPCRVQRALGPALRARRSAARPSEIARGPGRFVVARGLGRRAARQVLQPGGAFLT